MSSTQKKSAPKVDAKVLEALGKLETTSAKIRYLTAQGLNRGDISRLLTQTEGREVRYQWVRNVQITPIKKG